MMEMNRYTDYCGQMKQIEQREGNGERVQILHCRNVFREKLFWMAVFMLTAFLMMGGRQKIYADSVYGFLVPDASSTYLTDSDIAGMSAQTACYAKNEIYARNGRLFSSTELQDYFYSQYWYCGLYDPSEFTQNMLNVYESANVDLLDAKEQQMGGYTLDTEAYDYAELYQYMDSVYYDGYVDPDTYIFYDSDQRYISEAEISRLSLQELNYAKNEIYARRGRMFSSQELSDYFSWKNWYYGYISPDAFSDELLNSYEKTNAAALYAAEYAKASGGYVTDQAGYDYGAIGSYTEYDNYVPAASDFIIWDSNIRYLSAEEISGMSLQQLNYAKNEIYARRGYVFQKQELRDYFNSKYWYYGTLPLAQFSPEVFNDYEAANIALLEKHEYARSANGYQLY
ncbi:MAG: YARHG domain-containing protein [Lachnospiraceae bacterium]|nr:YARHG domain-containing protein [Lachnospiraceae bacterium]